jgi:hypothetical protein
VWILLLEYHLVPAWPLRAPGNLWRLFSNMISFIFLRSFALRRNLRVRKGLLVSGYIPNKWQWKVSHVSLLSYSSWHTRSYLFLSFKMKSLSHNTDRSKSGLEMSYSLILFLRQHDIWVTESGKTSFCTWEYISVFRILSAYKQNLLW